MDEFPHIAFLDPSSGERIIVYAQEHLSMETRDTNGINFLRFMEEFLEKHGRTPREFEMLNNGVFQPTKNGGKRPLESEDGESSKRMRVWNRFRSSMNHFG